jgi:cytoskeletal protein CcmA (bactofilin family)
MQNQRTTDMVSENGRPSRISEATTITGDIRGSGDLAVDGKLNGNIEIDGLLTFGKAASFNGEASAENMIIEGHVEGQVKANAKIEIRNSGHVQGNIICQKIVIAEGAFLDGKIKTKKGKTLNPEFFVEKRKDLLADQ